MSAPVLPSTLFIDQIRIRKLDGSSNWYTWKREILIIFQATDSDEIVSGVETAPTDAALRQQWTIKNKRAYAMMWACTEPKHRYLFSGTNLGSVAFQTLKAEFEGTTFARRVFLRGTLYKIVHDPSLPVDVYIRSILQIREQLNDIGVVMDDTTIIDIILINLDFTFNDTRMTLISQLEEPSLEMVKKSLLIADVFKTRSSKNIPPASKQSVTSQNQKASPPNFIYSHPTSSPDKCFRWLNPLRDTDCHRCGLPGHTAARCIHDMPQNVKDWIHSQPKEGSYPDETPRNRFT